MLAWQALSRRLSAEHVAARGGFSGSAPRCRPDNEINRQFPCRLFPRCYPEWAPELDRTNIRPRVTGVFASQGNC
jgi:hypothetical protein